MRFGWLTLILATFLTAAETYHSVLVNDGAFHAQETSMLPAGRWIAVNHTPEKIEIVSDEAANTLAVRALVSEGGGLIEAIVLAESGQYSLWFSYDLQSGVNPFAIALPGKRHDVPAVITNLPEGGAVEQAGEGLSYTGPKKGSFQVGYLKNDGRYMREQMAVTERGLIAFEAFIEVMEGGERTLGWRAAFKPEPALVLAGSLGDALIDDRGLSYQARSGVRGEDRIIFAPHAGAEAIILPVRVVRRSSTVVPPWGSFLTFESGVERFEGDVNGTRQVLTADTRGRVTLSLTDASGKSLLELRAPAYSNLKSDNNGGFEFSYGEILLKIDPTGAVRGAAHQSLIAFGSGGEIEVLPGGTLRAVLPWAQMLADETGLRIWNDEGHYPLLPPGSQAQLDKTGLLATVRLTAQGWFLPAGWVCGLNGRGEIERLTTVWGEETASLRAEWGGTIGIDYAQNRYEALPLQPVKTRLNLEAGWNTVIAEGFAPLETLPLAQVSKTIESGAEGLEGAWAQNDSALPSELNTLARFDAGRVYHIRAQNAVAVDIFVVPHAPVWPKMSGRVGIPAQTPASLELASGCGLTDEAGNEAIYYGTDIAYRLVCKP